MPQSQFDKILEKIHVLQEQLEYELEIILDDKRLQFQYSLRRGRVIFDENIHEFQKQYRTGIWLYIGKANPVHILIAPVIYSVVVPMLLLDLFVFIYQHICFRACKIPFVRRANYIVIDRQHLKYLNAVERFNCMYCGYANGLIGYVREVFARTEQYWCPIKHARRVLNSHQRLDRFSDYGDASTYRDNLIKLRKQLQDDQQS